MCLHELNFWPFFSVEILLARLYNFLLTSWKKTNIFLWSFTYSVELGYILTETQLVAFKDQKVQRSMATALITVQRCRGLVTFAPYTILLSYQSIYTKKYQTELFLFYKKYLYIKLSRYLLCTNRRKFQHISLDFLNFNLYTQANSNTEEEFLLWK